MQISAVLKILKDINSAEELYKALLWGIIHTISEARNTGDKLKLYDDPVMTLKQNFPELLETGQKKLGMTFELLISQNKLEGKKSILLEHLELIASSKQFFGNTNEFELLEALYNDAEIIPSLRANGNIAACFKTIVVTNFSELTEAQLNEAGEAFNDISIEFMASLADKFPIIPKIRCYLFLYEALSKTYAQQAEFQRSFREGDYQTFFKIKDDNFKTLFEKIIAEKNKEFPERSAKYEAFEQLLNNPDVTAEGLNTLLDMADDGFKKKKRLVCCSIS